MMIGHCLRPDAADRARSVRLMVFDVDGVLTDGRLHYGADGEALKVFHVHDGHGLKLLRAAGITPAVISGRAGAPVQARLRDLGISHAVLGTHDKPAALAGLLAELALTPAQAGFMGDDWVDLAVMAQCGFAATVPGATAPLPDQAHWQSSRAGGAGAVRECCDFLLHAQGAYEQLLSMHLNTGQAQG